MRSCGVGGVNDNGDPFVAAVGVIKEGVMGWLQISLVMILLLLLHG